MGIEYISKEGSKPTRLPKPCVFCSGLGHLAFGCRKRPKKPIRATQRLGRIGKKTKKWLSVRRNWLKLNPSNHEGYYICYLCKRWIPKNLIQLDHVKSRSRHPELVFDQSNLRPICGKCNALKGSKDLEEF